MCEDVEHDELKEWSNSGNYWSNSGGSGPYGGLAERPSGARSYRVFGPH